MERVQELQAFIPRLPSDQFDIAAACIALPSAVLAFARQQTRLRAILTCLILLHSYWILRSLLVDPPFNFFTNLNLPLMAPIKILRTRAKEYFQEYYTPKTDELISRFSSFDMRTFYVRYGHSVLLHCDYCFSQLDFALFTFAFSLPSFVVATGLLACIASEANYRERYRVYLVCIVIGLFGWEMWFLNMTRFDIPQDNSRGNQPQILMLHDTFVFVRQVILLLLPPITHFFLRPSPPFINPLATIAPYHMILKRSFEMLNTISTLRAAGLRNPQLRERLYDYAEEQEEDINGILEDDEVKEHAQKINMSYAEGPPPGVLRKSARERSEAIKDTIRTVVTNFQPPSPPTRSS